MSELISLVLAGDLRRQEFREESKEVKYGWWLRLVEKIGGFYEKLWE